MKVRKYSNLSGFDAESKFAEDYLFASALLEYVQGMSGEHQWFIDECVESNDGEYWVIFKSFSKQEYKDFILSVHVTRSESDWDFSIVKQVTKLS